MNRLKLTIDNKQYVVKKYADNVAYRMDDGEIYDAFKEYFYKEKLSYPLETLESEILKLCPEILEDNIVEQAVGVSDAKNF